MIGANQPTIRFRAILELVTPIETKYPKYRLAYWGGDMGYMLMLAVNLTGRRDKVTGLANIHFVLKPNQTTKASAPEMNLQVKGGQNLTGLKQWFQDGRLSGYAYGEPSDTETYGIKTIKANCFYPYRRDGFLFRCTPSSDPTNVIPTQIEWIVLKGGEGVKIHAVQYLTLLRNGSLDNVLSALPLKEYDEQEFSNI